ncbi:MAG: DMT family transporter [Thermacetogeniaceae bacterium]
MPLALISLLLALVAGITMALQGSLNTVLSKVIGLLEATFVVHLVGTVTIALVLLLFLLNKNGLDQIGQTPWYALLGGVLSVVIIYTVVASITKLGVAAATTAIIVGQVSTAVIIDHLGMFGLKQIPFTWWKLAGIVLLATGAKLMLNVSR